MSTGSVTPDDLFRLLSVDPDDGVFALVRAARRVKWNFPVTVMSVLAAHGSELSDGALAEVRRNRERADRYRAVAAALEGTIEVKGSTLAAAYPSGLTRHTGDLDLAAPDADRLWHAAGVVARRSGARPPKVAITGPDAAVTVSLAWPSAEDPWLVSDDGVELVTTPFVGGDGVPLRPVPDAHPVVLSLLAVLEERFQRPFCAADVLDYALVLGTLTSDLRAELTDGAIRLRLAPELVALTGLVEDFRPGLPSPTDLGRLHHAAEAERERRRVVPAPPTLRPGEGFEEFLHRGGTWCGLPLDDVPASGFRVVEEGHGGVVVETPVGGLLLVAAAEVEESSVDEAVEALARARLGAGDGNRTRAISLGS